MRYLSFIVAAAATLALPAAAFAHAHLNHADPAVGSTVPTAPKEVTLWFTQKLEPKFSTVEVHNAKDAPVQSGAATVDAADSTKMTVKLKPLPPGTYKVIWRVLSVDTHRTNGSFTFRVGP